MKRQLEDSMWQELERNVVWIPRVLRPQAQVPRTSPYHLLQLVSFLKMQEREGQTDRINNLPKFPDSGLERWGTHWGSGFGRSEEEGSRTF